MQIFNSANANAISIVILWSIILSLALISLFFLLFLDCLIPESLDGMMFLDFYWKISSELCTKSLLSLWLIFIGAMLLPKISTSFLFEEILKESCKLYGEFSLSCYRGFWASDVVIYTFTAFWKIVVTSGTIRDCVLPALIKVCNGRMPTLLPFLPMMTQFVL